MTTPATPSTTPDSDGSAAPMMAGMRVVEFASVLAGPAVGQWFAELGAEVIKVENPRTGGDVTRGWYAPGQDPSRDMSAYFACVNAGKRSVAIDLGTPAGRDRAAGLVDSADVVLTSFRPRQATQFGLDAASLLARLPRLIVGEISGYGPDDPRPAYDALLQAEVGFTAMNGTPASGPTKMPVALIDLLAAHQLKQGLLLALWQRDRTGQGERVHVALRDAGVASLANQATNYLLAGHLPTPMGNDHPNIVPYGTIFSDTAGQPLIFAVGSDAQFRALAGILGAPAWGADARYATNAARVANRDALLADIRPAVARCNRADLLAACDASGVPAGPVQTLRETFADPATQALLFRQTTTADDNPVHGVRTAIWQRYSPSGARIPPDPTSLSPAPPLGADTNTVLP